MKKLFFLVMAFGLTLSSCLPAAPQPTTAPDSVQNLEATAAVFSQQTLQALPSPTLVPSITPVITTPTETPTQATPTETQNPILLTLTATLGTGTAAGSESALSGTPGTLTTSTIGILPFTSTPSVTTNPASGITPAETSYPQYSGTMPPNLPFGEIKLVNKSKAEVYISLRCVTKDDFVTIIEYPVKGTVITRAPAGQYTYVVWVGGRKIVGSFSLATSQDLSIRIYKDRVETQ